MKKHLLLAIAALALTACGNNAKSNANNSASGNNDPIDDFPTSGEKGTLTNPYTIAEAIEVIGKVTTFSDKMIYIKGIVSEKPYHNDKYNSYSAYLIDQGGSDTVQVYSGTVDANAGQKDVQAGDAVIAGGYYCFFEKNSQPELGGDNASKIPYPVYYKIVRGNGAAVPEAYESLEDNGKETVTTKIEFTEDNAETMSTQGSAKNPESFVWTSGIVTMEYDPGTQYSFEQYTDPFRFYVGTYLHIRVSSGKIKYLQFATNSGYPFTGDEPVTNGQTKVESNTSTYIFAKTGTNYIKIHNSNKGEVKNVPIKQKRFYSLTVVSYK